MNPLTSVRGQTQILRRRIARGEPLDEGRLNAGLESIDVASARMTRLLDELADVMRLRSGQEIELHRESTDLVALARRPPWSKTGSRSDMQFTSHPRWMS